jgi:HPt (histidine-containing phosphotransfer) domain-containing protein
MPEEVVSSTPTGWRPGGGDISLTDDLEDARFVFLRRVGGDKLIRELIDLVLENAPKRLAVARSALACADAEGVGRAAHVLTSIAGNVGAGAMEEAALNLEVACDEPDADLAVLLGRLEARWESARERLIERRKGLAS